MGVFSERVCIWVGPYNLDLGPQTLQQLLETKYWSWPCDLRWPKTSEHPTGEANSSVCACTWNSYLFLILSAFTPHTPPEGYSINSPSPLSPGVGLRFPAWLSCSALLQESTWIKCFPLRANLSVSAWLAASWANKPGWCILCFLTFFGQTIFEWPPCAFPPARVPISFCVLSNITLSPYIKYSHLVWCEIIPHSGFDLRFPNE